MKKEALNITKYSLCIQGEKHNNYYWEDNGAQEMVDILCDIQYITVNITYLKKAEFNKGNQQ